MEYFTPEHNGRSTKMINKDLLSKYWRDFYIHTQEERTDFPYANVADAGRALIKGRNWTGTFTELLITNSEETSSCKRDLNNAKRNLSLLERKVLQDGEGINSYVSKNKELLKSHIWTKSSLEQRNGIDMLERNVLEIENKLEELESEKENIELILKKLEKTTDWLVQYINWMKFELRGLQQ